MSLQNFTRGILLALLLPAVAAMAQPSGALTITRTPGASPTYTIENPFYRVLLSSKEGGRILSFIDKRSGADLTLDGGPGQNGGMLDDRQKFTATPYTSAIMRQSPQQATLRLAARDEQGLEVVKILTFFADRPVIHLHYTFANGTQRPLPLWIRNFIELPGGIEKDKTHFFLSTDKGWQSLYANNFYRQLTAPWYAVIDRPTKAGFAYLADPSAIDAFYFYHGGRTTTMEWLDQPLPAGQQAGSSARMILLHGLDRVTLLGDHCALGVAPDIAPDGQVQVEGPAISLDPALKQISVSAKAVDAQGKTVHTWAAQKIAMNAPDGEPVAVRFPAARLPRGSYILRLQAFDSASSGGFRYHSAPIVIHVDGDKTEPAIQPPAAAPRRTSAIKGWKSDADRFTITDQDKQNGFWLSRGRDEGKARLETIGLNDVLGSAETDAVCFSLNSLRDLNDLPVTLSTDDPALAPQLRFFQENEYKLDPLSRLTLRAGTEKRLWIMIDSAGLSPGEHQAHVQLAVGEVRLQLPLKVEVYPVALPKKNYLRIKGYAPVTSFTGGPNFPKNIDERLAHAVPLFTQMGGRVMDWTVNRHQILPHVLVKSTGQHLTAKHEPFSLDQLPDLDFSYYLPLWNAFLRNGVDQFDLRLGLYPNNEFQPVIDAVLGRKSGVKAGTPQADRMLLWYFGQLRQAVANAGFTRFFCKIGDEFGPEQIPAYNRIADLIRQVGYRPYSTMTGTIPRTPSAIEQINPHLDQWQLGFGSKDVFFNLIRNPYRVDIKTIPIKGAWGQYQNGSAKDTWGLPFFGRQVTQSLQDLVDLQILENGKPLKAISGSPWGNTERGVFFTGGAYLYISPSDGTPADKTYTAVMKVRVPDADGRPLVKIDPTDEIWMYGGGTKPFHTPHDQFRRYGWIAAADGMQGFGVWAYWWWQPTERLVFYDDKTNTTTLTPAYWGVRDGWEEGQYLCQAMDGMSARQRAEFLKGIISTDKGASLRLVEENQEIYHFMTVGNSGDPDAWVAAKRKVLTYLSHR
jgi:hypothetical protein